MTRASNAARRSIRSNLIGGLLTAAFLVVAIGGWATMTELSGAVIAPGILVVDTNVKKVQHPSGGVVGELRVRDGDRVKSGDVVIQLDDTITRANLKIITKSLDELNARQARLEAERDDRETISFSKELLDRSSDQDAMRIIQGESRLFDLRRTARLGQKAQLKERIAQLNEETKGLSRQAESKKNEIDLIQRELEGVRKLWKKKLIPLSRVTAVEREAVRLDGERGQLMATIAQTQGRATETELQIIQIDQDLRSEVARELREIQAKTAELVERKVAAEDQLKRTKICAPQDGIVHQLAVHTIGGVINASETLMLIVPEGEELTIEAKVPPENIDQLAIGQRAVVRFSTFNQRTTPEIDGTVTRVGADLTEDERLGAAFYKARISMSPQEVGRLRGLKLIPGMPVEAFIQTDSRTVVSYLVKPLHDQIVKAFRER